MPEAGDAWRQLGLAHAELDHIDEAVVAYRRAVELNPKDALAWRLLAALPGARASRPATTGSEGMSRRGRPVAGDSPSPPGGAARRGREA